VRTAGAAGRRAGKTTADGEAPKVSKGQETRARILDSALALFLARGYEQTTMRAIAEEAGVALGNAYYYFDSKEHLIQAFYARTHVEHAAACASLLERGGTLRERLLAIMQAKIDTIEPYHRFAGVLFRTAADPQSPLNPFSDRSATVRDEATALFARVVNESTTRVPDDLRAELPRLLWLYHMGVILYWIHDPSEGRARTRRLVDLSVDLVAKLISLSGNPLLRPLRRSMLSLINQTLGLS
jgi:AcrR family transcriptional regulator